MNHSTQSSKTASEVIKERRESKEIEFWLEEDYPEIKRKKVNYLIEFLKLIRLIFLIPFIPLLFLACYWLESKEKRRGFFL